MGNILKIFGIVMGFVYLAAGTFIIVSASFFNLELLQKNLFGAVIIIYGIFRLYKSLRKDNSDQENDDNE